jgi:hypothetical protein
MALNSEVVYMYVGKLISKGAMELVTSQIQQVRGELVMQHPRCGRVVIKIGDDGEWRVTSVAKPDPKPEEK